MAEYPTLMGGIGKGISEGIQAVGALRGIQKQDEQEARALRQEQRAAVVAGQQDVIYNQAQQLWHEENDPLHTSTDVLDSLGLDEQGKAEVAKVMPKFGFSTDPNKKYSKKQIMEFATRMKQDEDTSRMVSGHKLRFLEQAKTEAEGLLQQYTNPNEPGFKAAQQALNAVNARIETNPVYQARLEVEAKRQKIETEREGLGIKKREVVVHENRAIQALEHEKAMEKKADQAYKLHLRQVVLAEETAHTDKAIKYLALIGKKEPTVVDMGDGTTKVVMQDPDPLKTLRKGWIMNPELMKKGGLTKPPKETVSWADTWTKANTLSKTKESAGMVAAKLKEQFAAEDINFTDSEIMELSKTYPNLKNLAPFFKVEKKTPTPTPPPVSLSYQPPLKPGEATVGDVISTGLENTGIFGKNPPVGYGVVQRGNVRDAARRSGTLGIQPR